MSIAGNIAKNTLAQGISRLGTILISVFGVTPLLTSHLTRGGFGDYIFVSALVLLFGTTSDWGTNIIAIREATQNPNKQPVIFGSSTLFRLILSLVSIFVVNILVRSVPSWEHLVGITTVGSLVLVALSFKTSMSVIFNSLFRLDLAAIIDFLSSLFFFGFLLITLYFKFNLTNVMWAWFAATVTSAFIAYFLAWRISSISWNIDFKIVKRIFWEAAPTGTLLLVFSLYNRLDVIMLQYFQGADSVGAYGLAYKMHENIVLGAAYLMTSLFPHLSQIFKSSKIETRNYYQKAFDILFVFSILQLIAVFVVAPFVVSFLGSGKFPDTIMLWKLLSVATVFAYFNHLTGYSLIAFGKQRASLIIAVVALCFNLLANYIFIPLFSATAAAYITIATEGLVLLLSTIVVRNVLGLYPSFVSFPQTIRFLFKEYRR